MSLSSLSQLEDDIQGLSLHDQLNLLERLVKIIRMQTGLDHVPQTEHVTDVYAPNGKSNYGEEVSAAPLVDNDGPKRSGDSASTLQETVARIKSRPPNPATVIQPTLTVDEVEAIWAADTPTEEDISPDEWDRLWAEFEAKLKAHDRAKDIAEGRL